MGSEHSISKQALKDKLFAIILIESAKPYKEMDSDLVTECVDFLMELDEKKKLTQKEIEQRINKIPFKGKPIGILSTIKKKTAAKRIAVIAAILAFIIAAFNIFAFATGNSAVDLLRQMGHAIAEMFNGETVDVGGVTIYTPHKTQKYDSIETLLKEEKIDILYPTWLPENEEIVSVLYLFDEQAESYILQCNNVTYNIIINLNRTINERSKTNCAKKEIGNFNFYYFVEGNSAQAFLEHNNNLYTVCSDTNENLFRIIENLKEVN